MREKPKQLEMFDVRRVPLKDPLERCEELGPKTSLSSAKLYVAKCKREAQRARDVELWNIAEDWDKKAAKVQPIIDELERRVG